MHCNSVKRRRGGAQKCSAPLHEWEMYTLQPENLTCIGSVLGIKLQQNDVSVT